MAGDLLIRILGDSKDFSASLDQANAKLGATAKKADDASKGMAESFTLGALAAVVAVGVACLDLGDKFDVAHTRLVTATKDVGENFDSFAGKVKATDSKMAALGFTSTDVETSIGTLTSATKDVGKATDLMGLAADIARGRHISLASATDLLVKVETGHVALLGRIGIATKDATGHTISATEAVQRLSSLYGGQASAYTDTLAGKFDVLKATAINLATAVGVKLNDAVNTLIPIVGGAIQGILKFNDATDGWAGKLVVVAAGVTFAIGAFRLLGDAVDAARTKLLLPITGPGGFLDGLRLFGAYAAEAAGGAGALGAIAAPIAATAAVIAIAWHQGDELDKVIKNLASDLVLGGSAAATASTKLNSLIGTQATTDLNKYTDLLMSGASGAALTATKTDLLAAAYEHAGYTAQGYLKNTDQMGSTTAQIRGEIQGATDAVDALTKKYGAAGVQTLALSAAEKTYGDDLVSGHASSAILTADKNAVIAASKAQAITQGKVNDAVTAGTAAATGNSAALAAQKAATKAYDTALADLAKQVGLSTEQTVAGMHLSTDSIKAMTAEAKANDDAVVKAFDSSGQAISDFSNKAHVSFQQFAADELKQLAATTNWSSNLIQLIHLGLNKGVVEELVKAGPASAGAVQAILDNVGKGSIGIQNNISTQTQKDQAALKIALDGMVTGAATASAQINALHTNFTIDIAGQPATAAQVHSLAVAQRTPGSGLSFDTGGFVPGPKGAPQLAIVHGGEFVVSNDMQAGKASTGLPSSPKAAVGSLSSSQPIYVQVIVDPVTGEQQVRQLKEWTQMNGPLPIKVA